MSLFHYSILIAADERSLGQSSELSLESQGYEVLWAGDAVDESGASKHPLPDIIISDLRMPNMNECPNLVETTLTLHPNKPEHKQVTLQLAFEECPPFRQLAGGIQQLVSNIISNVIDALPPNGTLKIGASLVKLGGGRGVRLTVEDNGPGIKPENLKSIFAPFYTTKMAVGSGLGIWVRKEVAERHRGSVQANSKEENGRGGSVFTILFPYQEGNKQIAVQRERSTEKAKRHRIYSGLKKPA